MERGRRQRTRAGSPQSAHPLYAQIVPRHPQYVFCCRDSLVLLVIGRQWVDELTTNPARLDDEGGTSKNPIVEGIVYSSLEPRIEGATSAERGSWRHAFWLIEALLRPMTDEMEDYEIDVMSFT